MKKRPDISIAIIQVPQAIIRGLRHTSIAIDQRVVDEPLLVMCTWTPFLALTE